MICLVVATTKLMKLYGQVLEHVLLANGVNIVKVEQKKKRKL